MMCVECAKRVTEILDKVEEKGEFSGLSDEDKEQERMMLGMRLRGNMRCPAANPTKPGYQGRVINHYRDGHATKEDWILLSDIFFQISVLGGIPDETELAIGTLNERIGPPTGIIHS